MRKQEQPLREWAARVAAYQASGQTMTAWCDENRVSKDQLKYWLRTRHVLGWPFLCRVTLLQLPVLFHRFFTSRKAIS
ncbi:hypothetical protein PAECIP111893_01231 [Paenibacillus plantiphilus]|uniref:Transposase n=1 Tax=Paenibacillus plantiphilus TaxID=2905650 RepID=A0ABN8G3P1_9BACL|nr:hypothetical protein PAECIP111893_01231 [Paenibacillus plantiphilus]